MKKSQANKVAKVVLAELKKMNKKFKWDMMPIVEVVESSNKGWFGVEIRTDSDAYDMFYDDYRNQELIEKKLNKIFKFSSGDHYFEKYGQGIVHLY